MVLTNHAPGAKLDSGKLRLASSWIRCLERSLELSELEHSRAAKYSDGGWLEVTNGIQRYRDAQLRHETRSRKVRLSIRSQGLPHDFHRAWNVLAQIELKAREEITISDGE